MLSNTLVGAALKLQQLQLPLATPQYITRYASTMPVCQSRHKIFIGLRSAARLRREQVHHPNQIIFLMARALPSEFKLAHSPPIGGEKGRPSAWPNSK